MVTKSEDSEYENGAVTLSSERIVLAKPGEARRSDPPCGISQSEASVEGRMTLSSY